MSSFFWAPPTEKQLARFHGRKTAKDFPIPKVEVWEENFEQVLWFRSMMTQFNVGPGGVIGFNYLVAHREFDDMGLSGFERDTWKWKLKIMEAQALKHFREPE